MSCALLSLGTAVPPYLLYQEHVAASMARALDLNEADAARLSGIYRRSAVTSRHTVLEELTEDKRLAQFLKNGPSHQERNALYKQFALPLAKEAAQKALAQGDAARVSHLIVVSCTGAFAPGIESWLIDALPLSRHVQRFGLNFMGCFGAFRALALARALMAQSPLHLVLIVCVELCSLHAHASLSWDNLVAGCLFADGAAAALVGASARGLWEIVANESEMLPHSREEMTWEIGRDCFVMGLSRRVPQLFGQAIQAFAKRVTVGASESDCDFPVHPGGKAILEAVENRLGLDRSQTGASWDVLASYGNMSSATFLFVLHELARRKEGRPFAAGLGFGPGLAMEGILLRRMAV